MRLLKVVGKFVRGKPFLTDRAQVLLDYELSDAARRLTAQEFARALTRSIDRKLESATAGPLEQRLQASEAWARAAHQDLNEAGTRLRRYPGYVAQAVQARGTGDEQRIAAARKARDTERDAICQAFYDALKTVAGRR